MPKLADFNEGTAGADEVRAAEEGNFHDGAIL